jgi:hypothetical protein
MMRPRTNGPRSLMVTTTDLPFLLLVTRTLVPNGNERCAAVKAFGLRRPPLATLLPLDVEYTDAIPDWVFGDCALDSMTAPNVNAVANVTARRVTFFNRRLLDFVAGGFESSHCALSFAARLPLVHSFCFEAIAPPVSDHRSAQQKCPAQCDLNRAASVSFCGTEPPENPDKPIASTWCLARRHNSPKSVNALRYLVRLPTTAPARIVHDALVALLLCLSRPRSIVAVCLPRDPGGRYVASPI